MQGPRLEAPGGSLSLAWVCWWPSIQMLPAAADLSMCTHVCCTNPAAPWGFGPRCTPPSSSPSYFLKCFLSPYDVPAPCSPRGFSCGKHSLVHGIHLKRRFLIRGQLDPQGTLSRVWRHFCLSRLGCQWHLVRRDAATILRSTGQHPGSPQ